MLAIIHTPIEKLHDVDTKMKMRLTQFELMSSTAVLIYIVFFALRPPKFLEDVLSSPIGLGAVVGGSLLVMLYQSKIVGGLLILAVLLTMTKVTEHLTVQEKEATSAKIVELESQLVQARASSAPDKEQRIASLTQQLALERTTLAQPTTSPPTTAPPPTQVPPVAPSAQAAAASPPIPQSSGRQMATPPTSSQATSAIPPKPVMACNIENFASF